VTKNFSSRLEAAMSKFSQQEILFSEKLSRIDLGSIKTELKKSNLKLINVYRNHNFESLIPFVDLYSSYADDGYRFNIGDYDSSLCFSSYNDAANLELVWFDFTLIDGLKGSDLLEWFVDRIDYLRVLSNKPILILPVFKGVLTSSELVSCLDKKPGVYVVNLAEYVSSQNSTLTQERLYKLAGTKICNEAQMILARALALSWLPSFFRPELKAVLFDLDNTLHKGVLGEDGIEGVVLTRAHKELQQYAKFLLKQGIFLGLISKNDEYDVKKLFKIRVDYPLKIEDFSVLDVSWGSKSDAISRASEKLRISTDSILYVDDNPGELASVLSEVQGINLVFAHDNPVITKIAIEYFPGIWRWKVGADDLKRIDDLKAIDRRRDFEKKLTNKSDYFEKLKISLDFYYDDIETLERASQLSSKTNQFNLSTKRLDEIEINARMKSSSSSVVMISLSDYLSDSGQIALVIGEMIDFKLVITELCISCRAMGRGLESSIILYAIKNMGLYRMGMTIYFDYKIEARNSPAIDWLKGLGAKINENNNSQFVLDSKTVDMFDVPKELKVSLNGKKL